MLQIKPHQIAAFLVFAAAAAWVATGEFSSVGSASAEDGAAAPKVEEPAVLRTVAAVRVPHTM
ncbi:MAG: efflux transporter periplasmic adaptor subunit, partial [Rhizobiaceae bacterium]